MARTWYYAEPSVVTPPNTSKSAPQVTPIPLEDSYIYRIKVRWPMGMCLLAGIHIDQNTSPIVPYGTPGTFMVGDDDEEWFEVGEEVQGGLMVTTYNLSVAYNHTHYLRIQYLPIAAWQASGVVVPAIQSNEVFSS